MLLKNVKGPKVWLLLIIPMVLDGIAGIQFLLKGKPKHTLAIIQAHFSFYSLIPTFLKKRKNFSSSIKYYNIKSIVWTYYIRKKRIFKELN